MFDSAFVRAAGFVAALITIVGASVAVTRSLSGDDLEAAVTTSTTEEIDGGSAPSSTLLPSTTSTSPPTSTTTEAATSTTEATTTTIAPSTTTSTTTTPVQPALPLSLVALGTEVGSPSDPLIRNASVLGEERVNALNTGVGGACTWEVKESWEFGVAGDYSSLQISVGADDSSTDDWAADAIVFVNGQRTDSVSLTTFGPTHQFNVQLGPGAIRLTLRTEATERGCNTEGGLVWWSDTLQPIE